MLMKSKNIHFIHVNLKNCEIANDSNLEIIIFNTFSYTSLSHLIFKKMAIKSNVF